MVVQDSELSDQSSQRKGQGNYQLGPRTTTGEQSANGCRWGRAQETCRKAWGRWLAGRIP